MLAHGNVGKPVFSPASLHLQEGQQGTDLLLHRVEPHERIELSLDLRERTRRTHSRGEARATKALVEQLLGVAPGGVTGLKQAFTEFVWSKNGQTLLRGRRGLGHDISNPSATTFSNPSATTFPTLAAGISGLIV